MDIGSSIKNENLLSVKCKIKIGTDFTFLVGIVSFAGYWTRTESIKDVDESFVYNDPMI
jgi:hypothetical protein